MYMDKDDVDQQQGPKIRSLLDHSDLVSVHPPSARRGSETSEAANQSAAKNGRGLFPPPAALS